MIEGARVLVVEDEFLVAAMICDMIEDAGGQVVGPAASVAEATALVAAGGIDIAVVDWNLSAEPGELVAEQLAQSGLPFVISTGYGRVTGAFASRPTLAKPYAAPTLITELARALREDRE